MLLEEPLSMRMPSLPVEPFVEIVFEETVFVEEPEREIPKFAPVAPVCEPLAEIMFELITLELPEDKSMPILLSAPSVEMLLLVILEPDMLTKLMPNPPIPVVLVF